MPALKGDWRRARRAYLQLLADEDPGSEFVSAGARDLRPGWGPLKLSGNWKPTELVVISGDDDLIELRRTVERMTGPGTWPAAAVPTNVETVETCEMRAELGTASSAMALLIAMEGLIDDRSRAWRKWKTVIDTVAVSIDLPLEITFSAVLLKPL